MTQSPFARTQEPEWLQEYYAIKAKYCRPGQLLFFQMGDFYEVLDADAATVAEALGSETRKREIGPRTRGSAARSLLMLGIPLQNLEQTVETLNKKGLEVVVAERVGDAQKIKTYSAVEDEAVEPEPESWPGWWLEYQRISSENPGSLVLCCTGDTYEFFEGDAKVASEALKTEGFTRPLKTRFVGTAGSPVRNLTTFWVDGSELDRAVAALNKNGLEVVVIERNERGEILSTRQYSAIETEAVAAEAADEVAESDPQAEERAQVAAAYQIEIDRLTREKDRLQDTLDEIQEANDELTAQRDALRAALDDARREGQKPAPVEIRTITAVWGRGEPEKLARSDADLAAALADGWQIINFMSAIDNGGLYNRVVTLLRRGGEAARHPEAEGAPPAPQSTPVELPDDVAGESGDASEGTQKAA